MSWLILPFWTLQKIVISAIDISKMVPTRNIYWKFPCTEEDSNFMVERAQGILLQVRLTKVRKHTSKWVSMIYRETCSSGLIHCIPIAALESVMGMLLSAWGGDVIDQFSEFTRPWTPEVQEQVQSKWECHIMLQCNLHLKVTNNTYIISAYFIGVEDIRYFLNSKRMILIFSQINYSNLLY